jgi:hypothetical protein
MQLEFFPRTELKTLSDFQKIENRKPDFHELREIISQPHFFQPPKLNQTISVKHSSLVDKILDFRCEFHEQMLVEDAFEKDPLGNHETWGPQLSGGVQSWIGLGVETLQTPYGEILKILNLLKLRPYQTVIDLGAAYGRMGVVIGSLFMKSSFVGYEFVKARVDEGNRIFKKFNFNRSLLVQEDLGDAQFQLPEADIYFIYDFGQVEHIEKMLSQIRLVSRKRPIKLAVKGKYSNLMISEKHHWVEKIYEGHFNLYKAFEN